MFAIYGTSGRLFHGPFEAWRQVTPILRSERVRAIELPTEESDPVRVTADQASVPTAVRTALHAYTQPSATHRQPLRHVAQVMSRETLVVSEEAELGQALEHLARRDFRQAPVVNAQGRLVGLLAWAQLLHPAGLQPAPSGPTYWAALMRRRVGEVMLSPVPSVEPETDIRRLALALLEAGLAGLPVVTADGEIAGFVSRSDVLRAVTHDPPLDLWAR
jgi:CBS-domain-containing membrane protein